MILEIEIPTDKMARVKEAFDSIYNNDMTKIKFEALIKEWIIDKVRRYEHEKKVSKIIVEDVF